MWVTCMSERKISVDVQHVYLDTLPLMSSLESVFSGSIDSPMTKGVSWCLPAPCLFLTSQMKVELTAPSTFLTVSLLSSTTTVSGKEPEALERTESEGRDRGVKRSDGGGGKTFCSEGKNET